MTIRVEGARRKLVGWLRGQPPPAAVGVLEEREYTATNVDPADIPKIRVSSAVVMTLKPNELGELTKDLRQHAGRILDIGCRVLVRVEAGFEELVAGAIRSARLPAVNLQPEFVVGQFAQLQPYILLSTILNDDDTEWRKLSQFWLSCTFSGRTKCVSRHVATIVGSGYRRSGSSLIFEKQS
jgi:hypothetical protein